MRLIDADALVKFLKGCTMSNGTLINTNTMLAVVEKMPTAYDISKVVAELETLKIDKCNYFGVLNVVAEKYDRANEMLDDAIEIVKELAEEYINTSTDISTNKSTEQPTWQQQTMNRFERVE